ncbi:MAG: hypothetical protein AAFR97_11565, partial [Bacteroidota bacterium]
IVSRNISTGCTYAWYEPIIIDTLIAPSLLGFTVNPPSDCGANDGQLEVSLSDTTEQYILELNGPDFIFVDGTITDNLGEGVYDLTIRNADGLCALVFPDTVHIEPPFHTVIDSIETLAASNCDVQDAVISIFPANEDYEYSFDGGQSWANVSTQDSLIAQLYQIGIRPTAFPGCIAFEEVDLSIGYSVAVDWTVEWSTSDGCEEEEPRDLQLLGATPDRLYSIDGGTTWSTDGTFTGLEAGLIVYISLAALDTSCINEAVDTLTVPLNEVLAVTIDTLIPPSCFDSEDGQIWLSANRPAEDLSFIWEDGTEGPELTGLGIGTYLATVSDGTCIDSLHIEIADETRISELLPGLTDTVLCGPTEMRYDFSEFPDLAFRWSDESGLLSEEPIFSITENGEYYLEISAESCFYGDSLEVSFRDSAFTIADFLMPVQAVVNQTVRVINITSPQPDALTWELSDPSASIVNVAANYANLLFTETGRFEVGLQATLGECSVAFTKEIEIVGSEGELNTPPLPRIGAEIQGMQVYPNPTLEDGSFNVAITLRDPMELEILLLDGNAVEIINENHSGSLEYLLQYSLDGQPAGAYPLLIRTANDYRYVMVVKQ